MNPKVDLYISQLKKWQGETALLRSIIMDCGLTEEFKWKHPCYTYEGSNIVLIHGFKEYCAVLFFKGVLLQDPRRILVQQTDYVQVGRQVRFTSEKEISRIAKILKAYIYEAIEVEKAGLKVPLKKTAEFPVADELKKKLDELPQLKKAFKALTPGRQRGYLLYFAAPKQSKTRQSRIEKYIPQILDGKGLNDA